MKFTDLNLDEKLLKGIQEAGLTTCMPVQEEALVHTLKGRDAMVQSQTGTGKTAVFLVTIFQLFLDKNGPISRKKALIITPTRELAVQIEKDAKSLGRYLDFSIGCFYGGVGYHNQERLLEKGLDIVVGTPGRLLDYQLKRKLDFKEFGCLVIDEADRLFDMGFLPDIRKIVDSMPRQMKRLTMLFSATIDARTRALAREYMKNPVRIEIMPEQVTVDKITQVLYHVGEKEKINLMLGILKRELPRNALVFTNMKNTAVKVARQLEYNGYKCQHISGDLPQNKRLQVMSSFKAGKLPILVATDVAARGLHIEDLELIINYDLPGDPENYVHRIGRTARAGKSGKAISLACETYIYNLDAIEEFLGIKIPVAYPDDELFYENKAEGMVFTRPVRSGGGSRPRQREKIPGKKHPPSSSLRSRRSSDRRKPTTKVYADQKEKSYEKEKMKPTKSTKPTPHKEHREAADRYQPSQNTRKYAKGKSKPVRSGEGGKKNVKLEDRLEYYKRKYGDNFKVKSEPPAKTPPSPRDKNLFKKIVGFLKRRK
jgi:ATP-dependent RNA helicase RhlB